MCSTISLAPARQTAQTKPLSESLTLLRDYDATTFSRLTPTLVFAATDDNVAIDGTGAQHGR